MRVKRSFPGAGHFPLQERAGFSALPQFGLVTKQGCKIDPGLAARDDQGRPHTVRYKAVNAMLLNEFLKEHRRVADQSERIEKLKATVAEPKSALKVQAAQIQKVSVQIENGRFAPRLVAGGQ